MVSQDIWNEEKIRYLDHDLSSLHLFFICVFIENVRDGKVIQYMIERAVSLIRGHWREDDLHQPIAPVALNLSQEIHQAPGVVGEYVIHLSCVSQ